MLKLNASIRTMTLEEQRYYKLINPGLMLDYETNSYVLKAGRRDKVECFVMGVCLYVLTSSSSLGYVGLDAYQIGHDEPVNSVFCQEQELYEVLGPRWRAMSSETKVQRLMEYLI